MVFFSFYNKFIKSLSLCFILLFYSEAFAVKLYDLSQDKILEEETKSSPSINRAVLAEEELYPPQAFVYHTQKFINREAELRREYNIAESSNIVQFCFYGFYNNGEPRVFEDLPFPDCQAVFYLSGNEPTSYAKTPGSTSNFFNTQGIGLYGKGAKIIQRAQPIVRSIEATLHHLSSAQKHIIGSSSEIDNLLAQVKHKYNEVANFRNKQQEVIHQLDDISKEEQEQSKGHSPNPLMPALKLFMGNFVKEIKTSIEADDFNFNLLGETKKNINVSLLLEKIKSQLAGKKLADLLNSKYFNLGCSEQLLLYDLGAEARRNFLSQKVVKALKENSLNSIWLQIHTTKTPCKACLLGCCGHLTEEGGWIRLLFNQIKQKTNVPVYLVVSYQEPYVDENEYGFSIPMVSEGPREDKILLVDARRLLMVDPFANLLYYDILSK